MLIRIQSFTVSSALHLEFVSLLATLATTTAMQEERSESGREELVYVCV